MKINIKALSGYCGLFSSIAYFFLNKYGLGQFSPILDAVFGSIGCGSGVLLHVADSPLKK